VIKDDVGPECTGDQGRLRDHIIIPA
jgi:hypothetical protein